MAASENRHCRYTQTKVHSEGRCFVEVCLPAKEGTNFIDFLMAHWLTD